MIQGSIVQICVVLATPSFVPSLFYKAAFTGSSLPEMEDGCRWLVGIKPIILSFNDIKRKNNIRIDKLFFEMYFKGTKLLVCLTTFAFQVNLQKKMFLISFQDSNQ